jgi:hypothetical protein
MTAITVVSSEVSVIKPKTPGGMGMLELLPLLVPSLFPVQDLYRKCKAWISKDRHQQN